MLDPLTAVAAVAIGYLLGAVSFARIVVKLRTGGEVAPMELVTPDGIGHLSPPSVSATAVRLQLGTRWGVLVGVLDILKALAPTLVFKLAYPSEPYFLLCAAAAPFGHNWPVYYRFRGGNGQSPILGGMLAVDWLGAVVTNVVGVLFGRVLLKDGFLGQVAAIPLLVPWLWWRSGGEPWHVGYAVAVNVAWWVAFWPTLKPYLRLRREGHLSSDDDVVAMFRMEGIVRRPPRRDTGDDAAGPRRGAP